MVGGWTVIFMTPRCNLKDIVIEDELYTRDKDDMEIIKIPLDDDEVIPKRKENKDYENY